MLVTLFLPYHAGATRERYFRCRRAITITLYHFRQRVMPMPLMPPLTPPLIFDVAAAVTLFHDTPPPDTPPLSPLTMV